LRNEVEFCSAVSLFISCYNDDADQWSELTVLKEIVLA
jgi:hypothetical protein